MADYTLVIHGGAGNIHPKRMTAAQQEAHRAVLENALAAGETVLSAGGTAVSAVEAAVCVLEDSPLFNAGKGSVFTAAGTQEMDAAIMDGASRDAGAVACISESRNPVQAARVVLLHSPHVLLSGAEADAFAREQGVAQAGAEYFYDAHRWNQLQAIRGSDKLELDFEGDEETKPEQDKYGTVGAVARDSAGNLAAATSTGGLTNKRPGRIGDTAMIGAGTYADNASCAVSCTGQGEYFMRGLVAAEVANRMRFAQESLPRAAKAAIHEQLARLGGKGGLIAVDAQGNFAMPFNTTGMFRGVSQGGKRQIAMFRNDTP